MSYLAYLINIVNCFKTVSVYARRTPTRQQVDRQRRVYSQPEESCREITQVLGVKEVNGVKEVKEINFPHDLKFCILNL